MYFLTNEWTNFSQHAFALFEQSAMREVQAITLTTMTALPSLFVGITKRAVSAILKHSMGDSPSVGATSREFLFPSNEDGILGYASQFPATVLPLAYLSVSHFPESHSDNAFATTFL